MRCLAPLATDAGGNQGAAAPDPEVSVRAEDIRRRLQFQESVITENSADGAAPKPKTAARGEVAGERRSHGIPVEQVVEEI